MRTTRRGFYGRTGGRERVDRALDQFVRCRIPNVDILMKKDADAEGPPEKQSLGALALHELARGMVIGLFASAVYVDVKSWEVAFQFMRDVEKGREPVAPIKYFFIVERAVRRAAGIGFGWASFRVIEQAFAEARGSDHFAQTAVAAGAGTAIGLSVQSPRPRQLALASFCAGWAAGLVSYVRNEMWELVDYRVRLLPWSSEPRR